MSSKIGRPVIPEKEKNKEIVSFYVPEGIKSQIIVRAGEEGISSYMRSLVANDFKELSVQENNT